MSSLFLLPFLPASYLAFLYRTLRPSVPGKTPLFLTDRSPTLRDATEHCERIHADALAYCEDVVVWHDARVAIISSDPGRAHFNAFTGEGNAATAKKGKLWILRLDSHELVPLVLEHWPEGRGLHTLGLGLLEQLSDSSGRETAILSAANYSQKAASIEMFRMSFEADSDHGPVVTAKWYASFVHEGITSPNAVIPLSEDAVLFTQSYGASPRKRPLLAKVEQVVAWPGGSLRLAHRDAGSSSSKPVVRILVKNISMANGIAMNDSKTILAVAACTSHTIHIYDIDGLESESNPASSLQVNFRHSVPVSFLPDNLSFVPNERHDQSDEVLLAAGHPDALGFLKTAKDPLGSYKAPSRVAKVTIQSSRRALHPSLFTQLVNLFREQGSEVRTVFESKGEYMGTSSTAASYRNADGKLEMLVCGLWEDGLLVCLDVNLEAARWCKARPRNRHD